MMIEREKVVVVCSSACNSARAPQPGVTGLGISCVCRCERVSQASKEQIGGMRNHLISLARG